MDNHAEALGVTIGSDEPSTPWTLERNTIRDYRKSKKESQRRFWARFGVTQSRGRRVELGTEVPAPVAILLRLYLDGVISEGDSVEGSPAAAGHGQQGRVKEAPIGPVSPP